MIKIAIVTLLTACGTAPKDGENKKSTDDHTSAPLKTPIGQSEIPTTSRPAMLVEALPPCDASQEGWIVYLKPAAALEACEAGQWVIVDLRGKEGASGRDGAPGADGKVGKDGADGKDGVAGTTGAAGPAGADGKPLAPNLWPDPITGSIWLLATTDNGGSGICTGSYRLPSNTELRVAAAHGMYGAFSAEIGGNAGFDCGWSFDNGSMYGAAIKPGVNNCGSYSGGHALPWGIYCLKAP